MKKIIFTALSKNAITGLKLPKYLVFFVHYWSQNIKDKSRVMVVKFRRELFSAIAFLLTAMVLVFVVNFFSEKRLLEKGFKAEIEKLERMLYIVEMEIASNKDLRSIVENYDYLFSLNVDKIANEKRRLFVVQREDNKIIETLKRDNLSILSPLLKRDFKKAFILDGRDLLLVRSVPKELPVRYAIIVLEKIFDEERHAVFFDSEFDIKKIGETKVLDLAFKNGHFLFLFVLLLIFNSLFFLSLMFSQNRLSDAKNKSFQKDLDKTKERLFELYNFLEQKKENVYRGTFDRLHYLPSFLKVISNSTNQVVEESKKKKSQDKSVVIKDELRDYSKNLESFIDCLKRDFERDIAEKKISVDFSFESNSSFVLCMSHIVLIDILYVIFHSVFIQIRDESTLRICVFKKNANMVLKITFSGGTTMRFLKNLGQMLDGIISISEEIDEDRNLLSILLLFEIKNSQRTNGGESGCQNVVQLPKRG